MIKYRVTTLSTENDSQTAMNLGDVFYLKIENKSASAVLVEIGNTAVFEIAPNDFETFQTGNPDFRFSESERLEIRETVPGTGVKVLVKVGIVVKK